MNEFREDQDIRLDHQQVRAIVIRNGNLLTMFRRKNGEEYYVIPGGHMRIGETAEQTAIREVEEETTVKIGNLRPAYEVIDYAKPEKVQKEYYFVADWLSGEPILSGEESRRSTEENYYEPQWLPLSDLDSVTFYPVQLKDWIQQNLL